MKWFVKLRYYTQCIRKQIAGQAVRKEILTAWEIRRPRLAVEQHFSVFCGQTRQPKVVQAVWLSSQSAAMGDTVHTTAKDGFKEGAFYDQTRPSYTEELVSYVVDSLYRGPNEGVKFNILELGAGTGKFTSKMVKRLDKGCTYLATEPSESFLSVLKENIPGVEGTVCTATGIPLPDNSVQNIICAQCFHWFATVESITEMARVLVPNGQIIMVWNNKDWAVDWVKEIEGVLTEYYDDDTPRAVKREWKTAIEAFTPLTAVEHTFMPGIANMKGDSNFIVDHFSSISVIAKLETKEREAVRARFRAVLDKYFKADQEIIIPFQSEYFCAKKS